MTLNFSFFMTSILLGVGLAMDAFSVSLANGLNEPCMKGRKMCAVVDEAGQHVVEPVEGEEGDEGACEHLAPHGVVLFLVQSPATDEHAEYEEGCCLEHSAVLPCPGEAGELSFPQVDLERFPEGASALHLSCFHPEVS